MLKKRKAHLLIVVEFGTVVWGTSPQHISMAAMSNGSGGGSQARAWEALTTCSLEQFATNIDAF